jgi:hypothetical protein
MTRVPMREQCAAECGARRVPGDTLCRSCRKRNAGRSGPSSPMELPRNLKTSGGANRLEGPATAVPQTADAPSDAYLEPILAETSEEEQYRELEELSRCAACGTSWGGHTLGCEEFVAFLDLTEEWHPGDYAETL